MKSAKRAIGVDYGLARIGIAVSDESKMIVSPWAVIGTEKKIEETVQKVKAEIEKIEIEKGCIVDVVVIGMPKHMDGRIGVLADEVLVFIEHLKKLTSAQMIPWDERLTSVQAERMLRESNMNRKKRSKSVDSVAAMIILQNYLDFKSLGPEPL